MGRMDFEQTELDIKRLVEDKRVFADLFNFLLQDTNAHIDPQGIRRLDTSLINIVYSSRGESDGWEDDFRWQKYLTVMETEDAILMLFSLTEGSALHRLLPLAHMGFTAGIYRQQLQRKENEPDFDTKDPRQYFGILKPVIPLAVYFSARKWDGSECMDDLFDEPAFPGNAKSDTSQKIPVISPATLSDGDIAGFSPELRAVMYAIKHAQDGSADRENISDASDRVKRIISGVTGEPISAGKPEETPGQYRAMWDARLDGRIRGRVDAYRDCGWSDGDIRSEIAAVFGLSPVTAEIYVDGGVLEQY